MSSENEINIYHLLDLTNSPDSILHIIDQQWDDIHHSRNQDWMYWAIIGALIAGIVAIFSNQNNIIDKVVFQLTISMLFFLSGLISFWAASISWSHWLLHIRKLMYIKWLESFFYIKSKFGDIAIHPTDSILPDIMNKKDKFVVNGMIYTMYMSIALLSILFMIGFIAYYLFYSIIPKILLDNLYMLLPLAIFIFTILFFIIYYCIKRKEVAGLKKEIGLKYKMYINEIFENDGIHSPNRA